MVLNNKKEQIQDSAYQAWLQNNRIGTAELATGMGKTFLFFKCLQTMPKGSNVLFLAETVVRENTVLKDAKEYKKFYKVDPLKNYNFKFATYQGAYKHTLWDYFPNANQNNTLVVMDEIHDLLSTARFQFISRSMLMSNAPFSLIPKLGLSATIDKKTKYQIDNQEITKFDLLNTFCPVIYTYSLQDSIDNKTTRDIKFFILSHQIDGINRNIQTGAKGKMFWTSEKEKLAYLDRSVRDAMFAKYPSEKAKKDRILQVASTRARFLYSLPSKIKACKELISGLNGKTLIFGQDSKTLLELCPTAIVADNPNRIQDLEDFRTGKTTLTAANKIIKQGENISYLDNLILLAYYSKNKDFVQMVGE